MNEIEQLQADLTRLQFQAEALGWRLAGLAREIRECLAALDRVRGHVKTAPLPLLYRPLAKAPRTPKP